MTKLNLPIEDDGEEDDTVQKRKYRHNEVVGVLRTTVDICARKSTKCFVLF